jgi:hypothetical protein
VESYVGRLPEGWRPADPAKVAQKAAGQEIAITIDSVKYNAEIPKDKFEPPDEIKAMLKK